MFCHQNGDLCTSDRLNWRFSKMTRRAGIGRWHAHEGRHTAVWIMSSNGVPIQEISDTVRHTGAERGFATIKDPAASDIARGWCRLMSLAPLMLFTTTLLIVRNQRILAAWDIRQQENARRAAKGLPPKTRRRRRKTLAMLTSTPP